MERQQSIDHLANEQMESNNKICEDDMLPTDPGLKHKREIIQPSINLVDESANISKNSDENIIEQHGNRLVSEGDEVRYYHSNSA